MLMLHAIAAPARRVSLGAGLRAAAGRFAAWCALCYARHEQRQRLAELDERMLKDVGISPRQAAEEGAKPWWRA